MQKLSLFKLVIGMCMNFSVFQMYGHQYEALRGLSRFELGFILIFLTNVFDSYVTVCCKLKNRHYGCSRSSLCGHRPIREGSARQVNLVLCGALRCFCYVGTRRRQSAAGLGTLMSFNAKQ